MIHDWGMGEKLYYEPEKQDAEKETEAQEGFGRNCSGGQGCLPSGA